MQRFALSLSLSLKSNDIFSPPGLTAESSKGDRATLPLFSFAQSTAHYTSNPFQTNQKTDVPSYKWLKSSISSDKQQGIFFSPFPFKKWEFVLQIHQTGTKKDFKFIERLGWILKVMLSLSFLSLKLFFHKVWKTAYFTCYWTWFVVFTKWDSSTYYMQVKQGLLTVIVYILLDLAFRLQTTYIIHIELNNSSRCHGQSDNRLVTCSFS